MPERMDEQMSIDLYSNDDDLKPMASAGAQQKGGTAADEQDMTRMGKTQELRVRCS